jgi:hypothetical protein
MLSLAEAHGSATMRIVPSFDELKDFTASFALSAKSSVALSIHIRMWRRNFHTSHCHSNHQPILSKVHPNQTGARHQSGDPFLTDWGAGLLDIDQHLLHFK